MPSWKKCNLVILEPKYLSPQTKQVAHWLLLNIDPMRKRISVITIFDTSTKTGKWKNWVTVTGDHHRVEIMAPMCFPPPKMVINMCHTYMLMIQIFCFWPNTQNGGHLEFLKSLIIKDSLNKFEKKKTFLCLSDHA